MSVLYFKTLYPGAEILAFEPDPAAFACLQDNITRNRLRGVQIQNQALARADGPTDFFYDEADPGSLRMSTVPDRMPKDRRAVDGVRLSRYIDHPCPS